MRTCIIHVEKFTHIELLSLLLNLDQIRCNECNGNVLLYFGLSLQLDGTEYCFRFSYSFASAELKKDFVSETSCDRNNTILKINVSYSMLIADTINECLILVYLVISDFQITHVKQNATFYRSYEI